MQKKCTKQFLSCILCIVLIVAMALFTTGCNGSTKKEGPAADGVQTEVQTDSDGSVLGEGSKIFTFTVVGLDGEQEQFEIHTDEETVGEALYKLGLIDGDEGEYGLYVKTVNGVTADYEKDGMYWSFYINGEYAQTGVDVTKITEGDSYSFKMEKA